VSYGVTAIRSAFASGTAPGLTAGYATGLLVTALFGALMFGISVNLVAKRSKRN
jgi:hypothetical protein